MPNLLDLYEAIKPKYLIFCDMDGVLVDFERGYNDLTGKKTPGVNSTYNKEQAYKNTEEERNLYESMRTPANTHLIDEIINKILVIDKYRQVMETFGLNWFDAEKEVDKYKVITKTQQEEIDLLKEELNKILVIEKRIDLYKSCLAFLKTRVDLDLALFKDDIWSH